MKKTSTLFLIIFFALLLIAGCGKKQGGKDVDVTDNTPVHIKYEITGKEPGTLDMHYKGKNASMVVGMMKEGQTMNMNMFLKDKILYTIIEAEGKKMGMKSDVSKDESFKDFDAILNSKEKLKEMEKTGSEEVLGYKCDIYKSKTGDLVSVYKERVPLKMVSKEMTMTATLFEPDVKIADDAFDPPKDIEFMDLNNMQNLMK
jgi:hypothetical protein